MLSGGAEYPTKYLRKNERKLANGFSKNFKYKIVSVMWPAIKNPRVKVIYIYFSRFKE